ncbi:MlaD family protein [Nocardia carnea]|uniref:MlaD family protein n=1 Tax=Nocardia carnea TaxID=37328 RepID=UPI002453A421|nr:MlaD family protein [Nocardia carnea]
MRGFAGRTWWAAAGVAVAVAAAAVVAPVVAGAGRPATTVCALFDTTFGLYTDAPVTIRGIEVGAVRSIEPRPADVLVRMTVDRSLPAQVRAAIVDASLLTDRRVELVGVTPDGPRLPPEACIAADRTATPVGVAESLRSFGELIDRLTRPAADGTLPLGSLLTGADRELSGLAPEVRAQLRSLADLLAAPDTFTAQLGELIGNSAELSRFVSAEWGEITTALTTFGPGLELLEQTLVIVKVLVGKLAAALGPMDRLFNQHFPYLMEILESSIPLVTLARTRAQDSRELLATVPAVVTMLRSMVENNTGAVEIGYRPPAAEIPAPDPVALCAEIHRFAAAECTAVADHTARLPLPLLVLTAVGGPR